MKVASFGELRLAVGEGPVWDAVAGTLLTVDIVGQRIVELDRSGALILSLDTPTPVVAVSRDSQGRLLAVLSDGLYSFDDNTGDWAEIARLPMASGTRLNDGKVDPLGQFVIVSGDQAMKSPRGELFRVGADGSVTTLTCGFILGNGPCWSPDGSRFYLADSAAKQIYVYEYAAEGPLGERRLFVDTSPLGGIPDGATVDRHGNLWIALCGAGKVACFGGDGELCQLLDMPTKWVSSTMFGGAALDRLFVTSLDPASIGTPGDAECGKLFVLDGLGRWGIPEPRSASFSSVSVSPAVG